jgi:hypothetical protein
MGAWKQFLSQDILVEPFEVNKSFTFYGSEFNDFDVQIDRLLGTNDSFLTNQSLTGNNSDQYQVLVYNSIKELYYSNFISSSVGSPVQTQSLFPGENPTGDVMVGNPDSVGRYENYLQTTSRVLRYIPTGSGDDIAVLSIPSRLWGDYIQPGSFELTCTIAGASNTYTDDGQGNVYFEDVYVGNIIYPHGIVVFTNLVGNGGSCGGYGSSIYGECVYGGSFSPSDIITAVDITCSFSSSYTIYETQYKATILPNEFNFSQNPSIISGSTEGTVYNFATGSYFSPYVTTVGLYDNDQNLLAVGKLSQPLPTSRVTDTTIFINIDR